MVVDAYHGSYDDSELSRMVEKNLHTHSFAELFCCNSGQIELNTEFGEIRLEGGDIAVIPAGGQAREVARRYGRCMAFYRLHLR